MSNEVYANNMEVSCKAADGKSICAFPDVCFTPPLTPATPPGVPIPYPNTGMASDTTSGSTSVQISGKEVMLKNKSYFSKSMGDEAGSAPKKGVVTSKNMGKVYFNAWSMDVQVEGENVVRMGDITTHNHASLPGNSPTWPYIDKAAFAKDSDHACGPAVKNAKEACKDVDEKDACPGALNKTVGELRKEVKKNPAKRDASVAKHDALIKATPGKPTDKMTAVAVAEASSSPCVEAMRCFLRPYNAEKDGKGGCCPGQTPHHIPPKANFKNASGNYMKGYDHNTALCACLEGPSQHVGTHGKAHAALDYAAELHDLKHLDKCNLGEYNAICAMSIEATTECDKDCIEHQLNNSFKSPVDPKKTKVTHKHSSSAQGGDEDMEGELDDLFG
ncbi:PAAR-like domain-containing protein [Variovorax sp. dw_954]|uniref:PAAR-like domain-containing protein n=1 Tax=Variovorax sp. dw_954 TaxID=2720078 RepID=UPI001BD507B2|nr:PAAR-like domain-containing protein [Variovorax sp. dw_954]